VELVRRTAGAACDHLRMPTNVRIVLVPGGTSSLRNALNCSPDLPTQASPYDALSAGPLRGGAASSFRLVHKRLTGDEKSGIGCEAVLGVYLLRL
jgi:hypothetical protein